MDFNRCSSLLFHSCVCPAASHGKINRDTWCWYHLASSRPRWEVSFRTKGERKHIWPGYSQLFVNKRKIIQWCYTTLYRKNSGTYLESSGKKILEICCYMVFIFNCALICIVSNDCMLRFSFQQLCEQCASNGDYLSRATNAIWYLLLCLNEDLNLQLF